MLRLDHVPPVSLLVTTGSVCPILELHAAIIYIIRGLLAWMEVNQSIAVSFNILLHC